MAGRGAERGAGRQPVPGWLWLISVLVPAAAVLTWLFWPQLTSTFGPSVIPTLSPVLPRPSGAPPSAKARYDAEQGVVWSICREGGGGQVSAEWWGDSGFYRAWIQPGASCATPANDETPGSLRLLRKGSPVLVLERLSASPQASRRRDLCDAAKSRGLAAHVAVARAVSADPQAGFDLRLILSGFAAAAPGYQSARPAGSVVSSQLCAFRTDPPPAAGETAGYMGVDMSLVQDRP